MNEPLGVFTRCSNININEKPTWKTIQKTKCSLDFTGKGTVSTDSEDFCLLPVDPFESCKAIGCCDDEETDQSWNLNTKDDGSLPEDVLESLELAETEVLGIKNTITKEKDEEKDEEQDKEQDKEQEKDEEKDEEQDKEQDEEQDKEQDEATDEDNEPPVPPRKLVEFRKAEQDALVVQAKILQNAGFHTALLNVNKEENDVEKLDRKKKQIKRYQEVLSESLVLSQVLLLTTQEKEEHGTQMLAMNDVLLGMKKGSVDYDLLHLLDRSIHASLTKSDLALATLGKLNINILLVSHLYF